MSGCYPGCFYYTDSCFRKDCKMSQAQAYKPAHGGYPGNIREGMQAFAEDQERAIASGIQAHSIGGLYPLSVVAIGTGSTHRYELHNLQTGKKAMCEGRPLVVRSWASGEFGYNLAHQYAEDILAGREVCVWG